ncbi:hypothetical protein E2562_008932 [Oryza meyeriana var. granulata]|uniref:Uncharacterized protein n=1 Tax=Oryza meyeriana var. granulata TaxID=110450 RepID=A0A6G1D168_9ORYZ|nr:hypothetical protein E2562_008932 [Oryza meyeriana var. granulata]
MPPHALLLPAVPTALDPTPHLFCCDKARGSDGASGRPSYNEACSGNDIRYIDSSTSHSSCHPCAALPLLAREGRHQTSHVPKLDDRRLLSSLWEYLPHHLQLGEHGESRSDH